LLNLIRSDGWSHYLILMRIENPDERQFYEDHFFVDLVFYNRLLQCYVIIDLKTDMLKHVELTLLL
jgi:predicted nuclease of restriction endonuclease-like (RecB) superfamily